MTTPAVVGQRFASSCGAAAVCLVAAIASPGRTHAQPALDVTSVYTSTVAKDCHAERLPRRHGPDLGVVRVCPGSHGFVVVIAEDDLRETVTIGRNRALAEKEPAAQQRFEPFNASGSPIEWLTRRGGRPFAIIQRWSIADNNDPDKDGRPRDKDLLIVMRLPPGPVCRIAYVDVAANPNAGDLARLAAQHAREFDCSKDKIRVEGQSGRAVELAQ